MEGLLGVAAASEGSDGDRVGKRLLADDVSGDLIDGIEVFRDDFLILHDDAELAFEIGDELEDAGRVDETGAEQRFTVGQPSATFAEEEARFR
jgi:hypothetical protein